MSVVLIFSVYIYIYIYILSFALIDFFETFIAFTVRSVKKAIKVSESVKKCQLSVKRKMTG